jgi:hypothetical protein
VGAVRDPLVRQGQTPSGQIAQSGRVSENLNAGLAVPDHNIATFRLDNHSPRGIITGHGQRHLWHVCILQYDGSPPYRQVCGGLFAAANSFPIRAASLRTGARTHNCVLQLDVISCIVKDDVKRRITLPSLPMNRSARVWGTRPGVSMAGEISRTSRSSLNCQAVSRLSARHHQGKPVLRNWWQRLG